MSNETKTEVQLTPFLEEVRKRAESAGCVAKVCTDNAGCPWLRILVGESGAVSIFGPDHHILTAQTQEVPPQALVGNAERVVAVATHLLGKLS